MVRGLLGSCFALGITACGTSAWAEIPYPLNPANSSECYEVWRARQDSTVIPAERNYYELSRSCGEILDNWPVGDIFERNRQYTLCRKERADPANDYWHNLSRQNHAENDICLQAAYAAQARANDERRARTETERVVQYEQAQRDRAASQPVGIQSTVSVIQSAPKQIVYGWGASTATRLGANYVVGGNWLGGGTSPRMRAFMGATSILSQLTELQQSWGNLSGTGRLSGSVAIGGDLVSLLANRKGGTAEGRLSAMIGAISIGLVLRINEAAQEDLARSLNALSDSRSFTDNTLNGLRAQESRFNAYLGIEQTTISLPEDDLRARLDEVLEWVEMQRQNNGVSSTLAMQRVAEERARAREAARRRAEAARQQAEQERQRAAAEYQRSENQRRQTEQVRRQAEQERRRVRRAPPAEPEYTAEDFMLDAVTAIGQAYINSRTNGGSECDLRRSACR